MSNWGSRMSAVLMMSTVAWAVASPPRSPAQILRLTGVPNYGWNYGCMGTAAGNLIGFWDRHGFPDFYTGPVNGGLAPLRSDSTNAGIVSLWASQAGLDGRPLDQPGHVDDYYTAFEDTGPDPYLLAGRPEHRPDCIGDFIGMNQLKWTNMADECSGNIDGYCFVYWDTNGDKRINFAPDPMVGEADRDVQSGLRAWTQYRGYDCEVFTQLADFNPNKPPDKGFTFDDLRAEIDSGYPMLMFLQSTNQFSRVLAPLTNANPDIHTMLAYGYYTNTLGWRAVSCMTSWGDNPNQIFFWGPGPWVAGMPLRGVIGYHPLPKIRGASVYNGNLVIRWDGPAADLANTAVLGASRVHGYVVEMSPSLVPWNPSDVSPVLTTNTFTVSGAPTPAFFRLRLVKP